MALFCAFSHFVFFPDTSIQYISQNVYIFQDRKFFKCTRRFRRHHQQDFFCGFLEVRLICDGQKRVVVSALFIFFHVIKRIHQVNEFSDVKADLAQIILSGGYGRAMVFCNTKFTTATLCNQLARLNFQVDCLHGDLSQAERNKIMTAFREGKLKVLVATDVAARGIDVENVDAVINYDVPDSNEYYTHRIGRTGRARRQGVSYLMYTPDEEKRVAELLRLTRSQATPVHFDFNHEKLVEEKVEQGDRFNIRAYF